MGLVGGPRSVYGSPVQVSQGRNIERVCVDLCVCWFRDYDILENVVCLMDF